MCVILSKDRESTSAQPDLPLMWGTDAIHEVSAYVAENAEEDLDEATIDIVVGGFQEWLTKNGFKIVDTRDHG